jgi:hypothetical protein
MRRIAVLLFFTALVAGLIACTADAPTPTNPKGNGGGSNALQVTLFTNNANPTAGLCSTVQAVVTLNGVAVPDGTGVSFSTNFGVFEQNGQPSVSVVTQNGSAVTAICSTFVGVAKVRASVTIGGSTASSSISVSFQPSAAAVPFFSFCTPNNGPNTGGTTLTINGGLFFGDASSTRVQFTAMGVTRQGVVQTVTSSAVTVLTPAFPEATSPSVPVDVTITFGTNTGSPLTISAPSCFTYGSVLGDQPTITAVLPSTGSNDGGTRVTIIGSGFIAPVQVFFGSVESPAPTSVTYNQIVVLSPAATPQSGQVNATVGIRVHNVVSGKDGTLAGSFTYVTKLIITSASNTTQSIDGLSPVTIFGQGFSSPVAVALAGVPATVSSVSNTQVVVMPSEPLLASCGNVTGGISVTNINTGDSFTTGAGLGFTYVVPPLVVSSVSPNTFLAASGGVITITGSGFPSGGTGNVTVTVGGVGASVTSVSPNLITAVVQPITATPPACGTNPVGTQLPVGTKDVVVTNQLTKCSGTDPQSVTFTAPCQ